MSDTLNSWMRRNKPRRGPSKVAPGASPIAHAIAAEMTRQGMSIARLASDAGVTRATVYRWFTCDYQPHLRSAEPIANVLGLMLGLWPLDPVARAQAMADWLRGEGWSVEPPNPDARASPRIAPAAFTASQAPPHQPTVKNLGSNATAHKEMAHE